MESARQTKQGVGISMDFKMKETYLSLTYTAFASVHTWIKPLLTSRCGVFKNWPPADVHVFSGLFHLILLVLVKGLIASSLNYL